MFERVSKIPILELYMSSSFQHLSCARVCVREFPTLELYICTSLQVSNTRVVHVCVYVSFHTRAIRVYMSSSLQYSSCISLYIIWLALMQELEQMIC